MISGAGGTSYVPQQWIAQIVVSKTSSVNNFSVIGTFTVLYGHPEEFCSECTCGEEERGAGLRHHEMYIRDVEIQEEVYLRKGLGMILYTITFKCLLSEKVRVSSPCVLALQSCGWQHTRGVAGQWLEEVCLGSGTAVHLLGSCLPKMISKI